MSDVASSPLIASRDMRVILSWSGYFLPSLTHEEMHDPWDLKLYLCKSLFLSIDFVYLFSWFCFI